MDNFVIVYINDIFVYSKMVEEHAWHLEAVFQKLKTTSYMPTVRIMTLLDKKLSYWAMC